MKMKMKVKVLISFYFGEAGYTVHRVYLEKDFDKAEQDLQFIQKEAYSAKQWELQETEVYE